MRSTTIQMRSPRSFNGLASHLDWLWGAATGPRRRSLIISGLLALALILMTAVPLGLHLSMVTPAPPLAASSPLSGTWGCSLAGEPIGNLSVDGWSYVLGSKAAGIQPAGVLERVVLGGKYHDEIIRVPSGTLREEFGVKLGFHYNVAGQPEVLVFNTAPGSGIRCTRR